jgi:hypothetical protein
LTSAELARLDELAPVARPWFEAVIREMQLRGFDPYIGTVWRSPSQQQHAIMAGTTSAHQTLSWHELGTEKVKASRAVDFRRRWPNGGMDPTTSGDESFWRALYETASGIAGMRSLAYEPPPAPPWTKLLLNGKTWDAGHVEYRAPFATLLAAVKAESPHLLVA